MILCAKCLRPFDGKGLRPIHLGRDRRAMCHLCKQERKARRAMDKYNLEALRLEHMKVIRANCERIHQLARD